MWHKKLGPHQRLYSDWASTQPDQSPRCTLEEIIRDFTVRRKINWAQDKCSNQNGHPHMQSDHSHRYTLEEIIKNGDSSIFSMGNLTSRGRNEVHGIYSRVIAIRWFLFLFLRFNRMLIALMCLEEMLLFVKFITDFLIIYNLKRFFLIFHTLPSYKCGLVQLPPYLV